MTEPEIRDHTLARALSDLPVPDQPVDPFFDRLRERAASERPSRIARLRRRIPPRPQFALLFATALIAGLVGAAVALATRAPTASEPPAVLTFTAESGWSTMQTPLPPPVGSKVEIAWAANVPFAAADRVSGFPIETAKALPPDGVVVYASLTGAVDNPDEYRNIDLPLRLADGDLRASGYENQPAPNVSSETIGARVRGQFLLVHVWFGSNDPPAASRAAANEELARLSVPALSAA